MRRFRESASLLNMVDLVIFDFDGTLVDTAPDLIRSVNIYLKSKGFETLPDAVIRREIGMGLRKLILDLFPNKSDDENFKKQIESEFVAIYEKEFLHSPRLFEGAIEFLSEWDGKIAIVSNKRVRFINPILQKLSLEGLPWQGIIGGDTFAHMKPHPLPFLHVIQGAGTMPERTVVVGDGAPDVEGALAIGSKCVAVDFGYTPAQELMDLGAWKSIDKYSDLLPLIRSLN